LDTHQQKRIKANRICRRNKKEFKDKKIKELNVTNKKRDKRKFHKNVRNLSIVPNITTLVCKVKAAI